MGQPPEVANSSVLTDADWAELNRLWRAHESGGRALDRALQKLMEDSPDRYVRIAAAYFPGRVAEVIKDEMAEAGLTMEDVREMLRKGFAGDQ